MASCAMSHMFRHAINVTTGLSASSDFAASLCMNAVTGRDGDKNQTW